MLRIRGRCIRLVDHEAVDDPARGAAGEGACERRFAAGA